MTDKIEDNEDPGPGDDPGTCEPDELDDEAIVEQIEMPPVRLSTTRLIVTLIVVVVLILGFRFIRELGIGDGEQVSGDGSMAYSVGDIISYPFGETETRSIDVMGAGTIELFPGASLRVERQQESESGRFTLLGGRIMMAMPKPDLRVIVVAKDAEIGTNGSRLFVELWEEYEKYRLRVGVLEGRAWVVTENGEMLNIYGGDGIYLAAGTQVNPVAPPVTTWPGRVPRLDGMVFPSLNKQNAPSIAGFIESICRQVGLKVAFTDNHPYAGIPVHDDLIKGETASAGELLDLLGLRFGFRYGVEKNELKINILNAEEHLAAIGEWAVFTHPEIPALGWPENVAGRTFGDTPMNLVETVRLPEAPIEVRVGALITLMAGRSIIGGEYVDLTFDAEFAAAFDALSPRILKKMAFEDLYTRSDTPVERIMPLLEKGDLYTARDYFRLRTWGLPGWANEEMLQEVERNLEGIINSNDDNVGKLYVALAVGTMDTMESIKWFEDIFFGDNAQLGVEATRYFYEIAHNPPDGVPFKFVGRILKRAVVQRNNVSTILSLEGLRTLAGTIDRDPQLMLLLKPLTSSVTSAVTRLAAFTIGNYTELFPRPADEESINVMISDIEDPNSEGGRITLWALAIDDGHETIPGLVRQDLMNALAVRLGKITEQEERLWMLRILRAQRAELEGATGLGWVRGTAVDAVTDLLKSKDTSYLVDAILSLGLTDPAPGQPGAEPAGMRTMVDEKFISLASHTDPRLRLLAARYLANNNPPGKNEALTALADDEYPAIAREVVEASAD